MKLNKATFLYSASIMAISNIGLQLLGFIYRIALSHFAGAEGLGVYRLVISVYAVISAGCLGGLSMACSRLSSTQKAHGRYEQIKPLFQISVGIFLVFFSICAAVIIPFHNFIASTLLGDSRTADALPIMLICLLLTGIENITKSIFIGISKVKYTAFSEISEQIIRFIAVICLLYAFGGNDYGKIAMLIMLGMTISECFSVAILSLLFKSHTKKICGTCRIKPIDGLAMQVANIAIPLSLSAFFMNIISSANAIILPKRLIASGMTQTNAISALGVISGMATPLIMLPIALISAVSAILIPSITAAHSRRNKFRVQSLCDKAITVTGLIAIPATAVLVPLAPSLARIFFGYQIPILYMALLGVAAVFSYYQMITSSLLHGIGAQKRAITSAILGEILQLFLTWILASKSQLQIYGYIISMLISPIPVFIFNVISLKKCANYKVKYITTFLVPIFCGLTLYLWTKIFYTFFMSHFHMQSYAVILTLFASSIYYFFVLSLFKVKKNLLK